MRVRDLFDKCAKDYDKDRKKLVPCFDEFYGTALSVIPFKEDEKIDILDLGAGTGLFSSMVLYRFPASRILLADISESMLEQAKTRFGRDERVNYSVQDHKSLIDLEKYDLVISALSIHHLENHDKKTLFNKIFESLKPGGMFINADQALAPSPSGEAFYEKMWLSDVRENSISESSLEGAIERMKEDKNALLSEQMNWLEEAGFIEIDCWYKRFRFAVFEGKKSFLA